MLVMVFATILFVHFSSPKCWEDSYKSAWQGCLWNRRTHLWFKSQFSYRKHKVFIARLKLWLTSQRQNY